MFQEGIDSSDWYETKGMKLKHPCVGLVQRAQLVGKVWRNNNPEKNLRKNA